MDSIHLNRIQLELFLLTAFAWTTLGFILQEESVCFEDLGCFFITRDFIDIVLRPLNPLPESPLVIKTTMWLYTRDFWGNPSTSNPSLLSYTDDTTVTRSGFRRYRPLKIICHGYMSSAKLRWIKSMVKTLLSVEDVNVITVDWSKGSSGQYPQACSNTRVVGRQIAFLIKILQAKFNYDIKQVHLIGHSLGAHISGYVGAYFNGSLGRISGLDPARPLFEFMPPSVRLDPTDATFVDVLHTSGTNFFYLGVGLLQPIGHVDIYIDGGDVLRSCENGNILDTILSDGPIGVYHTIMCNHQMAHDLYIDSMKNRCPFIAHACDDIDTYKLGACSTCNVMGKDCTQMGYYADRYRLQNVINIKFFLSISSEPYSTCLYHWLVIVETTSDHRYKNDVNLFVLMKGDNSVLPALQLRGPNEFQRETSYRFFVEITYFVAKVKELEFWWERSSSTGSSNDHYDMNECTDRENDKIKFKKITFIPADIIDIREREKYSSSFCSRKLLCGLPPNMSTTLTLVSDC